jgi:hypothetical protein
MFDVMERNEDEKGACKRKGRLTLKGSGNFIRKG